MNNKEKIIKSGVFLVATALILIVVTVAWFISGSLGANTSQIEAEVFTEGYGYSLLEAEDTNMNGVLDAEESEDEDWTVVQEVNVDISNIVPNQYHFYKAIIQPGGSIADADIIKTADKYKIPMVLTGIRHFRH